VKHFLLSPRHDLRLCFALVTSSYGTRDLPRQVEVLPSGQSLWPIEKYIDRWFEESPEEVMVQKGTSGTYDRSVRMMDCSSVPAQ